MKDSTERGLLLAAGEIPLGKNNIKECQVETNSNTICTTVSHPGIHRQIICYNLAELDFVIGMMCEFSKNAHRFLK